MSQIGSPLGSTAFTLFSPRDMVAATTTLAGTDMKDFVDDVLVILSVQRPNAGAGTLNVSFKDSPDNSTFTALTTPTFSTVTTATATTATVSINSRAIQRYLQANVEAAGTTMTYVTSLVAIGVKQVI